MKSKLCAVVIAFAMTFVLSGIHAIAASGPNIVPNANLETPAPPPNSNLPLDWNQGNWGSNHAVFTYPVPDNTGVGAEITMTEYVDGDAKWYPNPISVNPFETYMCSDSYSSDTTTSVVVQFTKIDGSFTYSAPLIALPPTNNLQETSPPYTVNVPDGVNAFTPFHLMNSNGSLTIDNLSCVLVPPPATSFSIGVVSISDDDGWLSALNALPILKKAGLPATFYIISEAMLNSTETIFPSTDNPINATTTSKSVTWSQIYSDPTQHHFIFSDGYTATGPSTVTVSYKTSKNVSGSLVLGTVPAGTNARATFSFILPPLAPNKPLTIKHALAGSTGTFTATDPLLTEAIGYMDTDQVLSLQTAGMEIGNHTMNHCNLATLFANPNSATINPGSPGAGCPDTGPLSAPSTAQEQIAAARTALISTGASPVDTFAYPYGAGAGNPGIEALIQADGMIAARSVNPGYNTPQTDPFDLNTQVVDASVTNFTTVKAWIDYAAANKLGLILTFHQIESNPALLKTEPDATTVTMFQQIVTYLQQQSAAGKIVVDTIHDFATQYLNH